MMGKVAKGIKCNVQECNRLAVKSLSTDMVIRSGLLVEEARKTYLCRKHHKEFKRKSIVKKQKKLEKWRRQGR